MAEGDAKNAQNRGQAEDERVAKNREAVLFDEITVLERGLNEADMALA